MAPAAAVAAAAGTDSGEVRGAAGGAASSALGALDAGAGEGREILLSVAVRGHFRTLRFQDLKNGHCSITSDD